ncbi:hypothetical protein HJC23_011257 [Cyclotella cryptica]|uniref:Uncharacterized protein n=1 Tax=Cyclotella cryptica TaxID=29204 RepID=A0ABD3QWJ3_9STRA|eukprot:CCRYP_001639-RA/>CCRYP_001639-RA protein AED:0.07 eAED:0.07 QI:170/1/1/1/1/1/2/192/322
MTRMSSPQSSSCVVLFFTTAVLVSSIADAFCVHPPARLPSMLLPYKLCMRRSRNFHPARLSNQVHLSSGSMDDSIIDESFDTRGFSSSRSTTASVDSSTSSDSSAEDARSMLALEMSEVGPEGMPLAPMMTFQKFLTMQEKRVKVTIRYSAGSGLRPFYLTVASRIKSTHPDVLLEKRILPPSTGSDATESVFEVAVDGKTVIGKKKTKLLKIRSSSSSSSSSRSESEEGGTKTKDNNEASDSDIAGGRSVFVSMEKLEQELNKARKRRRPSTMYKSKEDALRSSGGGEGALGVAGEGEDGRATSEAVLRLERLKAMSSRKN